MIITESGKRIKTSTIHYTADNFHVLSDNDDADNENLLREWKVPPCFPFISCFPSSLTPSHSLLSSSFPPLPIFFSSLSINHTLKRELLCELQVEHHSRLSTTWKLMNSHKAQKNATRKGIGRKWRHTPTNLVMPKENIVIT